MEMVYIETTIISYLAARPSRDLVLAAQQQITHDWWHNERKKYHCISSNEVYLEVARGDQELSRARLRLLAGLDIVPVSPDIEALAEGFIRTGALPPRLRPDAMHLAVAARSGANYLLTWNCRHIANSHIIRRLRQEARRQGWGLPEVCTPMVLMGDKTP